MNERITLSLLIPVYNEAEHVGPVLDNLLSVAWDGLTEFVIIDDCSQDDSVAKIKHWLALRETELKSKKISVVFRKNETNLGKGASLHRAIKQSSGAVLIVQDADSEYDPHEVPGLVRPILENRADVVFGSRFRQNVNQAHRTYHYLVNRLLTLISNLLSGLHLTDMETCYKAFRAEILKNMKLSSRRFGFEPEVTAHLARLNVRVWELPVSYFPRSYLEGKKITWRDGVAALRHLVYFNCIQSNEDRFLPEMPQKYLPRKRLKTKANAPYQTI